ncbi:hypothetical protein RRG08_034569 [Elysia crispata]|uniref:Uncharacterized protein n=1 Tax=Elysia crispata TaxID=231223 RepID=A0AAE1B1K4_9GAST|nr:hypothetical protein RRG08_034569 [Elysia crispata]
MKGGMLPSYKLFQSSDLVRVLEGREAGTGKGMVDVWDQRYGNDEDLLMSEKRPELNSSVWGFKNRSYNFSLRHLNARNRKVDYVVQDNLADRMSL